MKKTKAIVDTCFLLKLSSEGKKLENIKKILDELDYIPVIHPYIYQHEILNLDIRKLVDDGYIEKIEYEDFIPLSYDKQQYEGYFFVLHNELVKIVNAMPNHKYISKLNLRNGENIYDTHKSESSMGDIHIILLAQFTGLPVILTEDSDIDILRDIVKRYFSSKCPIEIYNAVGLIKKIAGNVNRSISKKDLESVLDEIGERRHRAEVREILREVNQST